MLVKYDSREYAYNFNRPEKHTRQLKTLTIDSDDRDLLEHCWVTLFGCLSILVQVIAAFSLPISLSNGFEPINLLIIFSLLGGGVPMSYKLIDYATYPLQLKNAMRSVQNRENTVQIKTDYKDEVSTTSYALSILLQKTDYGPKLARLLSEHKVAREDEFKGYERRLRENPDGELWPKIFGELNIFLSETTEIDRQWVLHSKSANTEDLAAIDQTLMELASLTSANMQAIEDEHRVYIPALKSGHISLELTKSVKALKS